jgi:Icc-related predicted phosphoesterase
MQGPEVKFQIITDIHIEHGLSAPFDRVLKPAADTLIISGDLYPIHDIDTPSDDMRDFITYLNDGWKRVVWVPGNHDYEGMVFHDPRMDHMNETIGNITIINNDTISIDDVNFLCTTLWSYIPPQHESAIKWYLNQEFTNIGNFNPLHYNKLNVRCIEWLRWAVDENDYNRQKCVVVTHHLPTWSVVDEIFKNDKCTYGFANTDIDDLIEKYSINAWIYGHSHFAREEEICDTLLVRNPVGYPAQRGRTGHDPTKVIEV